MGFIPKAFAWHMSVPDLLKCVVPPTTMSTLKHILLPKAIKMAVLDCVDRLSGNKDSICDDFRVSGSQFIEFMAWQLFKLYF